MNFYFDIFSFINSLCHVLFKNVFLSNGRLTGILYLVFLKFKLGPKKLLDEIVRLACEDFILSKIWKLPLFLTDCMIMMLFKTFN